MAPRVVGSNPIAHPKNFTNAKAARPGTPKKQTAHMPLNYLQGSFTNQLVRTHLLRSICSLDVEVMGQKSFALKLSVLVIPVLF